MNGSLFSFRRLEQVLLLRLLDRYRRALDAEGKKHASDQVTEVMDMVVGYCSEHMRLANFLGRKA